MAFWGVAIKPGKPFTHVYDSSKGRLHVSQATLGLGTGPGRSVVQCNVGNKTPVFLCSLFPEKTESLQLHVEFEEDEEVIFSVVGPRSVHLTGHYVGGVGGGGRHFNANDDSEESYGEDIADTETDRSDCSDEDTYEDSFIDDSDPIISPSVSIDGVINTFNKKKPKKAKSKSRRLRKKYQVSESDDDNCLQLHSNVNGKATVGSVDESEDDDFFTISSLCKPKTTLKSTNIEPKDKLDKKAIETDNKNEDEANLKSANIAAKEKVEEKVSAADLKIEDDGYSVKDPSREIGDMVVDDEAKSLLPSTDKENGAVSKKKKKEQHKKQNRIEASGANLTNTLVQGPKNEPSAEEMHQDLPLKIEHQEAAETQEAQQLDITTLPVAEVDSGNAVKSKKKKRRRKQNTALDVDGDHKNVVKEDKEQTQKQGNDEKDDVAENLPLLESEVGSELGAKRKKKRKERSKGQSFPEDQDTQHNSVIKEDNNKQEETRSAYDDRSPKHANIMSCDNEAEELAAENQPKKKKKKKTKIMENEEIA